MMMEVLIVAFIMFVSCVTDGSSQHCGYGCDRQLTRAAAASVADDAGAAWQDARAGCSIVERILAEFPTNAVDRSEGEVRDYRTGRAGPGCRVEMQGSAAAFQEGDPPDVALREKFSELGWTEDLAYGADGPDGSAFAFRKGAVLCVFRAHWDGGDDSDPTYVPEDRYDIEVDCLLSG
jgi:hypothetical protein